MESKEYEEYNKEKDGLDKSERSNGNGRQKEKGKCRKNKRGERK